MFKVERCPSNYFVTSPAGHLFVSIVDIKVAMVFHSGYGESHRAFPKGLGKLLLRLLQRLFRQLALGNVHRHSEHALGVAIGA